jgi:hypothetical protein
MNKQIYVKNKNYWLPHHLEQRLFSAKPPPSAQYTEMAYSRRLANADFCMIA